MYRLCVPLLLHIIRGGGVGGSIWENANVRYRQTGQQGKYHVLYGGIYGRSFVSSTHCIHHHFFFIIIGHDPILLLLRWYDMFRLTHVVL